MALEIERKFLLPGLPEDRLQGAGEHIEQGYVAIDARAEVRVRRRDGRSTLTVKSAPARTRIEEEIVIDDDRFASLWALSSGRRVSKTRHLIEHGGATIELDEYHDALSGLVIAEIEFASEEASDAFDAPAWLGREITGDARYATQTLATTGLPDHGGAASDQGRA
jgi:CYTH domain-containing protein